jgi:GNAT superfamily N-acetyltransferase
MDPTIRVREAESSDRDLLLGFHQSLYQRHRDQVVPERDLPLIEYENYERVLRDDITALLGSDSTHVLIAEVRGVAVGYITGRVEVEPGRVLPRRGIVEDWYVVPESRGSGLGALLLKELEQRFIDEGCQLIESATWSGNEGARRAHDALGFHEIRVIYRKRL